MTRCTSLSLLLLLSLLLPLSPALAAEIQDFKRLIPEGTEFIAMTDDLPQLTAALPQTPFFKAAENRDVNYAMGEAARLFSMHHWERWVKKQIDYSLQDLTASFAGPALFLAPRARDVFSDGGSFALVLKLSESHKPVQELIDHRLQQGLDRLNAEGSSWEVHNAEDEHFDQTLHIYRYQSAQESREAFGWALADDLLVVASPIEYLKEMIASLSEGEAESPWVDSHAYTDYQGIADDTDLWLWVKGDRLGDLVAGFLNAHLPSLDGARMRDGTALDEEQLTQLREAQLEAYAGQMLGDLSGLLFGESMRGIFLQLKIEGEQTDLITDLYHPEGASDTGLLAYLPGAVGIPDFVRDDAESVSVMRLDFPRMWHKIKQSEAPEEGLGGGAEVNEMLEQASAKAGFDVERNLLDGLGDQVVVVGQSPEDANDETPREAQEVIAIALKDSEAVRTALEPLLAVSGLSEQLQSKVFLETTVYSMKQETGEEMPNLPLPAYAVTDDYLLYANGESPLLTTLGRMNRSDGRQSLGNSDQTRALLAALPEGYVALSISAPDLSLLEIFNALGQVPVKSNRPKGKSCEMRPTLERGFFAGQLDGVVSATWSNHDGLRTLYRFHHASDEG